MHERAVRLVCVIEAPGERGELFQGPVGVAVGRAFLECDRLAFTGRLAAFERHVNDLGHRSGGRKLLEPALAQDRGFERELRGKAGTHLFLGARRTGLVIEDDVAACGIALDAVGDAAQPKRAFGERNVDLAFDLGGNFGKGGAPLKLPAREPMRDALKARPPEGARLGKIFQRGEMLAAELDAARLPHRPAVVWRTAW